MDVVLTLIPIPTGFSVRCLRDGGGGMNLCQLSSGAECRRDSALV